MKDISLIVGRIRVVKRAKFLKIPRLDLHSSFSMRLKIPLKRVRFRLGLIDRMINRTEREPIEKNETKKQGENKSWKVFRCENSA